ncbi:MAG: hypothetical protein OHK0039_24960 [Bacteroidia bacterium]
MKHLLLTLALVCAATLAMAVPFTLHNNTITSIPLVIPGVMNPNLSPLSDSGVDLEEGQKIYFIHKKKRYLLLVVTEDLRGQTLQVGELIAQRKRELGL